MRDFLSVWDSIWSPVNGLVSCGSVASWIVRAHRVESVQLKRTSSRTFWGNVPTLMFSGDTLLVANPRGLKLTYALAAAVLSSVSRLCVDLSSSTRMKLAVRVDS